MPATLRAAESSLAAVARIADEAPSAQEILERSAERIGRVVPSDGWVYTSTDPETILATGSGVVSDLPLDQCQPTWDYEFLVPEPMNFRVIARSGRYVADVHEITGGRPERSPRYRQYSIATGFKSEVRIVFGIGGKCSTFAHVIISSGNVGSRSLQVWSTSPDCSNGKK